MFRVQSVELWSCVLLWCAWQCHNKMVSIAEYYRVQLYVTIALCCIHVAQLKCWVGTAGGSLGVFTVTRRNVGEPLQLEKTGNFVCMYWYLEYFSFQNIFNQEKASRRIQLLQAFSCLGSPLQHMGLTPQEVAPVMLKHDVSWHCWLGVLLPHSYLCSFTTVSCGVQPNYLWINNNTTGVNSDSWIVQLFLSLYRNSKFICSVWIFSLSMCVTVYVCVCLLCVCLCAFVMHVCITCCLLFSSFGMGKYHSHRIFSYDNWEKCRKC